MNPLIVGADAGDDVLKVSQGNTIAWAEGSLGVNPPFERHLRQFCDV
jgi:hypothetical protein